MAPTLPPLSIALLIDCFKNEVCLWDFNHKHYNKKEKRAAALKRIVEKLADNGNILTRKYSLYYFGFQSHTLCKRVASSKVKTSSQ